MKCHRSSMMQQLTGVNIGGSPGRIDSIAASSRCCLLNTFASYHVSGH